jgi:hypothetical protein
MTTVMTAVMTATSKSRLAAEVVVQEVPES